MSHVFLFPLYYLKMYESKKKEQEQYKLNDIGPRKKMVWNVWFFCGSEFKHNNIFPNQNVVRRFGYSKTEYCSYFLSFETIFKISSFFDYNNLNRNFDIDVNSCSFIYTHEKKEGDFVCKHCADNYFDWVCPLANCVYANARVQLITWHSIILISKLNVLISYTCDSSAQNTFY